MINQFNVEQAKRLLAQGADGSKANKQARSRAIALLNKYMQLTKKFINIGNMRQQHAEIESLISSAKV